MLLFELIQVALGAKAVLSHAPSIEEWRDLYRQAEKQAVLGVCFHGVQQLKEQKQYPPKELLLHWIVVAEQIKKQNIHAFNKSSEIVNLFAESGFRSCILKGQGNALMYNDPYSRIPGDIDIWVEGERKIITKFVKDQTPYVLEQYHHIDFPIFNDIPVEVHYIPSRLLSPKFNKRFQKYCIKKKNEQMNNWVELPDGKGKVSVPTLEFNAIFQMCHIMNHFFVEGIGIRHFIDYYYVLKTNTNHMTITNLFEEFGLIRFARGVMWIEKECLGLEDKYLLVEPDERRGRVILKEMLEGGNFGHHDERYKSRSKGYIARGITDVYRLLKLATVFPSESLWKIYRKVENQKWKFTR